MLDCHESSTCLGSSVGRWGSWKESVHVPDGKPYVPIHEQSTSLTANADSVFSGIRLFAPTDRPFEALSTGNSGERFAATVG